MFSYFLRKSPEDPQIWKPGYISVYPNNLLRHMYTVCHSQSSCLLWSERHSVNNIYTNSALLSKQYLPEGENRKKAFWYKLTFNSFLSWLTAYLLWWVLWNLFRVLFRWARRGVINVTVFGFHVYLNTVKVLKNKHSMNTDHLSSKLNYSTSQVQKQW